MKAYHSLRRPSLILLTLALTYPTWTAAQQIPSPEQFFGHQMGADRQLARWDKLVEYYDMIGELSDRVRVEHMGPSTLGNPFLSIFVSSPENLANLDEIKRLNAILQDPRGHSQAEVDNAIENSKVVFVQSYGLHSTEVAASQSAAEIMYDFATRDDDGMREILDNTVSILIPAFNPAGIAVSLLSLRNGSAGGSIPRTGLSWYAGLAAACFGYPIERLAKSPGMIDFVARTHDEAVKALG